MTKISCTFPTLKRMTHLAARFVSIRRPTDFNSTSGWLFQFKSKVRKHGHNHLTHYSFVDCSSSNSSYVSPTPFLTLTVLHGYNWTNSVAWHVLHVVPPCMIYRMIQPAVTKSTYLNSVDSIRTLTAVLWCPSVSPRHTSFLFAKIGLIAITIQNVLRTGYLHSYCLTIKYGLPLHLERLLLHCLSTEVTVFVSWHLWSR